MHNTFTIACERNHNKSLAMDHFPKLNQFDMLNWDPPIMNIWRKFVQQFYDNLANVQTNKETSKNKQNPTIT